MQVLLIGNNNIYKTDLVSNVSGEYWISDEEEKKDILKIEAINGVWKAISNSYAKIVNPKYLKIEDSIQIISDNEKSPFVEKATLKNYGMYVVSLGGIDNIYILQCLPDDVNDFLHMEVNHTKEITIGSGKDNSIVYNNVLVSKEHAKLLYKNSNWYIKSTDLKIGTFVNNWQIQGNVVKIKNGDLIFIMGLKIVMINNKLFVNNPQNEVSFNQDYIIPSKIKSIKLDLESFLDDDNIEIAKEEKYFSRPPRIMESIETEKIIIDPPPAGQNQEDKPLGLILGPSIAFGFVSLVTFIMVIYNIVKGNTSLSSSVTTLLFPIISLISMLVIPILNMKYEKNKKENFETKRQQKYKDYLNKKQEKINKVKSKQKKILAKNYLSSEQCEKLILEQSYRLWERRIEDADFLSIRLGIGNVPLQVDVKYPEEKFELEDADELYEIFNNIFESIKYIDNAPITTSLRQNSITSFIFEDVNLIERFMQNIILQLITFHSYEDLKLVFLVKDTCKWQYVKMLPHIWDTTKRIRFFADEFSEVNEVLKFLSEEVKARTEEGEDEGSKSQIRYTPHYLIITDDYKRLESFSFFNDFSKLKPNSGFSMLCITDDFYKLPNECKAFAKIDEDKMILFDSENSRANQKEIKIEKSKSVNFNSIAKRIANIQVMVKKKGAYTLPSNYSFLTMYDVGNIKNLNIWDRWTRNDSAVSLKAQIGIDGAENPIYLDIHEKYHGPHGLIAGSTGSGKSEFIMTYILSLAVNFHPDDVNFLLIDYKGGGLAGAFQKNEFKLPHLVGTITNIDKDGLQRSLISVESELRRRQVLFNEVRNIVDEGTIDIYKYQRLYHAGVIKEPVSHLLIICDEFAELKQQQPEFMEELMSVSRIGRSLGVHLILATQKPAGIVNDQIRSNSKFAICLKVQDTHDSMDVIKRNDAAFLRNPGQFYFQVGNGEYFVLGQCGWAGAAYVPAKSVKKKLDTSVEFVSDIGFSIKKVEDFLSNKNTKSQGEQLSNIVKYICSLANKENIRPNSLWLDNIPEDIYLDELRKKYDYKNQEGAINIVLGEYDDPANQSQGIIDLNLMKKENIIVYGNAESGRETLLSTFIYDSITKYSTEKIQYYLMDFGSEALKIYANCPHVGDVLFTTDEEKLGRLFDMLSNEIKERRKLLSSCNGDYDVYLSKGNSLPMIVCIMNNYENFAENYEMKFDEKLSYITREGPQYGILFLISCSSTSSLRFRLKQNFTKKIALQLNKTDEYVEIFTKNIKKNLPHIFGRGFITIGGDEIYEFQTAKICDYQDYNYTIEKITEILNENNLIKAKSIPVVPPVLAVNEVKPLMEFIEKVPIGMIKDNLKIYTYDFKENFITVIGSKNVSYSIKFAFLLLDILKDFPKLSINVLDAEAVKKNRDISMQDAYTKFVDEMQENIENEEYENCLAVIIGINKFFSEGNVPENMFNDFLKNLKTSGKCSCILIDNPILLKRNAYSDWYRNYIVQDSGIWIGKGMTDQSLINCNVRIPKDLESNDCSYGFIIKEGEYSYVKLVGMKKESEDE